MTIIVEDALNKEKNGKIIKKLDYEIGCYSYLSRKILLSITMELILLKKVFFLLLLLLIVLAGCNSKDTILDLESKISSYSEENETHKAKINN